MLRTFSIIVAGFCSITACAAESPPMASQVPPAPVAASGAGPQNCAEEPGHSVSARPGPAVPREVPKEGCVGVPVTVQKSGGPVSGTAPSTLPTTALPSNEMPIPVPDVGILRP